MNKSDYEKRTSHISFDDHEVQTVLDTPQVTKYRFFKRSAEGKVSSTYYIEFILTGGALIVLGDCYEAIYLFGTTLDREFCRGMDLDYFHSKCRASGEGTDFSSWNERTAIDGIREELFEFAENRYNDSQEDEDSEEPSSVAWESLSETSKILYLGEYLSDISLGQLKYSSFLGAAHSKDTFSMFLNEEVSDYMEDLFGDYNIYDIGMDIDFQCLLHYKAFMKMWEKLDSLNTTVNKENTNG